MFRIPDTILGVKKKIGGLPAYWTPGLQALVLYFLIEKGQGRPELYPYSFIDRIV